MKILRGINSSAAIIVLVCFFLPWEQVSCAGAKDNLTGWDLAQHNEPWLWVVPLLAAAIIISTLIRLRSSESKAFWLGDVISGLLIVYLMNRERLRVHDESGVIVAQLTGWFWLAFISTVGLIASAFALMFGKRGP